MEFTEDQFIRSIKVFWLLGLMGLVILGATGFL